MAKSTNKNQLGKGIRALLSNMDEKDVAAKKLAAQSSIQEVSVAAISVNPFQPRTEFDQTALDELSESIKLHGLIQPITVRRLSPDTFQLISGERRLRASKKAGLKTVPVYIREANDQGMLEYALVENVQRKDLNAIEVAVSLERLVQECGFTHEVLSDRIGKNRSTVTNYLRLLKLPPEIQKAIKSEVISMGHARAIVGVENLLIQAEVYKQVIDKNLSVRATEELIRAYGKGKSPKKQKKAKAKDLELVQIEGNLKKLFGNPVTIQKNAAGKGKLEIHFKNIDNLNYILEVLDELQ